MNKLYQKFLQTNRAKCLVSPGDRVLCAVSGGADSIALLYLLAVNAKALGISVVAIHVNHGLRGAESDADEAYVRTFCEKHQINLVVRSVTVGSGASLEAEARKVRYLAFEAVAEEYSCNRIATAHTANDNAETVLFHLVRGSGTGGLGGIPYVREKVIRPLLDCTRTDILEYLQENQLIYCTDSSNDSLAFSRNRIRKTVLPELEQVHSGAVESINRTSRLLKMDADYFYLEVERCLQGVVEKEGTLRYPIASLLSLHEALQSRVIVQLVQRVSRDPNYHLEYQHIQAMMQLLISKSPSAELHLPSGVLVRRAYHDLVFCLPKVHDTKPCVLELDSSVRFGRYQVFYSTAKPVNVHRNFILYEVNSAIICNQLILRSRKIGDRLKLAGRFRKSLKRMMIDEKIEKQLRDELPVVLDGEQIVMVHGLGVDEHYCTSAEDEKKYIGIGLCEE